MDISKLSGLITRWRVCCLAAVLLAVVTFTPLVIPEGRSTPTLVGLPYTLWVGVLVSLVFVVLTFVGTRVHPDGKGRDHELRSGDE